MINFIITFINIIAFYFNPIVGMIIEYLVLAYILFFKKKSLVERLLECIIYSVPFYYYSFSGNVQRLSPSIILLIILLLVLISKSMRKKLKLTYNRIFLLLSVFLITILYSINVYYSSETPQLIIDTYQLIVEIWLIVVIRLLSEESLLKSSIEDLVNKYFMGLLAVAASIYLQFALYRYLGLQVGFLFVWGQGSRIIFNSIYIAKSILSLYLSVGMTYYFIKLFDKVTIKRLFIIVFIGGAVLINNSRTGIMCFMVIALVYAFVHIRKIGRNVLLIPFAVLGIFALVYVINTMLSTRSGLTDFSDDNGRIDLILNAIRHIKNYILTGIGGSEVDYLRVFGDPTPIHNFVIQYMLQFGVVSGLLITIIYFVPFLRSSGIYKFLTGIIVLGGMLFANWHNALFLFPLMILSIIKTSDEQYSKEKSAVNEEK